MRSKSILAVFIGFAVLIVGQACDKEGENETNISTSGSNRSHNMGQNCMNCHKSGGPGEGWFNIAGTVYDSTQTATIAVSPSPTVKLYTGPNGTGTLKYTVQVDRKGNFYTTEAIDFGSGLYLAIDGPALTKYMSTSITTGQCNSCHGVSTGKIWVK